MASAAGLSCVVDPVLLTALNVQRSGNETNIACVHCFILLLMVVLLSTQSPQ